METIRSSSNNDDQTFGEARATEEAYLGYLERDFTNDLPARPGHGPSHNASRRSRTNRPRHFLTVVCDIRSRFATTVLSRHQRTRE
jgi:hypothetical protein